MFSLLFLGRDFLLVLFFRLGICLPSLWSAPSPLHDFALMPLFLAKVRLSPTLTLSSLMIWYSGQTALFLFLLVKATPALLANWSLCGTETTLCFSSGPVCSSVSAEACTIVHAFANLGSTNKSGIFLLFSSYLTLVLSHHSVLSSTFPLISNSVADTRPRTPLISFCTIQLRTFCAAHFLATLSLSTTSGSDPGELPGFWSPWSSAMPPSLGRGGVINDNNNYNRYPFSSLCQKMNDNSSATDFH